MTNQCYKETLTFNRFNVDGLRYHLKESALNLANIAGQYNVIWDEFGKSVADVYGVTY